MAKINWKKRFDKIKVGDTVKIIEVNPKMFSNLVKSNMGNTFKVTSVGSAEPIYSLDKLPIPVYSCEVKKVVG